MAAIAVPFFSSITAIPKLKPLLFRIHLPRPFFSISAANSNHFINRFNFRLPNSRKLRQNPSPPAAAMIFPHYPVFSDTCATIFSGFIALSVLRIWEETAKRGLFHKKLNRKLVHISIGLVFMLCWPLFSSGYRGAVLAAVTPGVNIIRMFLIGSGIWKDEATVNSMSRYGDYRELLKGPLYYAQQLLWLVHSTGGLHLLQLLQYATFVLEMALRILWKGDLVERNFLTIRTSP